MQFTIGIAAHVDILHVAGNNLANPLFMIMFIFCVPHHRVLHGISTL